jgi:hypothetical protein
MHARKARTQVQVQPHSLLTLAPRKVCGKPHAPTALARRKGSPARSRAGMYTVEEKKNLCSWWRSKSGRAVFISVYHYYYDYHYVTNDSEFIAPKYI